MYDREDVDINCLPLGNPEFSDIQKEKMIYVDKTSLIYKIASQRSPIFFSRPRRFGKTLLINTFHSLFKDGLKYFKGLEIEKKWKDKTYKVVHLDFSVMAEDNAVELIRDLGDTLIQEFCAKGIVSQIDEVGLKNPNRILDEICINLENNSTVLLIDEYDAPLTHHINDKHELKNIIKVLNNFYATVKKHTGKFRLIFITGVTRISHISIFSSFNNLTDLSLDEDYNSLLGFTQSDLKNFFDPFIENSANILKMTKEDIYQRIAHYYDGFQFSLNASETLYNPWSVISFLKNSKKGFKNYWFKSSGSSSIIMQYLKVKDYYNPLNYQNDSLYITEDSLADRYEIDKIPTNVLLYQSGYLTIRKISSHKAQLVFPNTEVEESILLLYISSKNFDTDIENYCNLDEFISNIDKKNLEYIINIFNGILNQCVSSDSNIFNDERSIRDIIYAAIPQTIELQKFKERPTIKGRSDLDLLTRKTHMVIEFKRTYPNRSPQASLQEAINQIRSRNYGVGAFLDMELFRVAIVLSTEEKRILPDFCREFF